MSNYPEHDKLKLISDDSQTIGEFLNWMQSEKGAHFYSRVDVDRYEQDFNGNTYTLPITNSLVRHWQTIEQLLAEFYGLDIKRLEAEKEAMYQEMRAYAEQRAVS